MGLTGGYKKKVSPCKIKNSMKLKLIYIYVKEKLEKKS
jgi:hypothetical protein